MRVIRDYLSSCIVGPAFFAGYLYHLVAEGFAYGREVCDKAIDVRAAEYSLPEE